MSYLKISKTNKINLSQVGVHRKIKLSEAREQLVSSEHPRVVTGRYWQEKMVLFYFILVFVCLLALVFQDWVSLCIPVPPTNA